MKLKPTMFQLAKQASGSHKTVHDRIRITQYFCDYLQQMNIQIKSIEHLKSKHIEGYITDRLAHGISKRTLQNEMAAIRAILRQAGREKLADLERLNNQNLGIGNASRAGTKEAIPNELFQQIMAQAMMKDRGLAVTIQLARQLGLRSEEAVQSIHSLKTWKKALEQGKAHVNVVFGTKGGRARDSVVLNHEELLQTVNLALDIAKEQNGKLINKPNLKTAMTYWRNQTRLLGLSGKYAPHSLRYAWAQEVMAHYLEQGLSEKEAQARVSMDLGHGDGRGRYIKNVYRL
ncbi:integrase domain-containing protein [Zophobihabitans entericus]|uniref:Site-specific integrase n=1 Tax=Zophobihabitans entericus TaxID=1635327 RepID=A0A6G9ID74_9GAMM|nr:integrase domain-containing protein [Zophobihabitans entericus]QIQ22173.1 site-specific integrase [Zophobihabitans entericus]